MKSFICLLATIGPFMALASTTSGELEKQYVHVALQSAPSGAPTEGSFPLCASFAMKDLWEEPNHQVDLKRDFGGGVKLGAGILRLWQSKETGRFKLNYWFGLKATETDQYFTPWGEGSLTATEPASLQFGTSVGEKAYDFEIRITDHPHNLLCD